METYDYVLPSLCLLDEFTSSIGITTLCAVVPNVDIKPVGEILEHKEKEKEA